MTRHYNIPVFLPEAACPFRCVYCNQYSIAGQLTVPSPDEVRSSIEAHLRSFKESDRYVEVAFFGGNFTGLPVEMQDEYMAVVQPFIKSGEVQGLRCSTRPDYIKAERLKELKDYGMLNIELGAQSTNDNVLRRCGRGHTFEDIKKASELINEAGITLGLQMMLGLPESSHELDMRTARDIVALGAKETRIYPCIVVNKTGLATDYQKGLYSPLTLEEAVSQAADVYSYFVENDVTVLRVGLHPSDELDNGDCIAGPYHRNFAEMVYSELWRRKLSSIEGYGRKIVIETSKEQRTNAIGYQAQNKTALEQRFGEVVFSENDKFCGFEYASSMELYAEKPMIIASALMPEEAKKNLAEMGEVVWLEPNEAVYPSISTHPDIFFFQYDSDKLVFAPDTKSEYVAALHKAGIKMTKGKTRLGNAHPETVHYNACATRNTLIHNIKHTDIRILDIFKEKRKINVKQGYTRCNLVALNENAFITSDHGIKEELLRQGFEVLYIDPHQVRLDGHEYGFFPGCCGVWRNMLVVCGSIENLREKNELEEFVRRNNFTIKELYNGELVDVGSILFLNLVKQSHESRVTRSRVKL